MKQLVYNLTLHPQNFEDENFKVEQSPRLRPATDPTDYGELKALVRGALQGIEPGACVLVGGLGQYQALITDLGMFRVFFANFNPAEKRVVGLVEHQPFTRAEKFMLES